MSVNGRLASARGHAGGGEVESGGGLGWWLVVVGWGWEETCKPAAWLLSTHERQRKTGVRTRPRGWGGGGVGRWFGVVVGGGWLGVGGDVQARGLVVKHP
jgi:hypothetical protein